MEIFVSQEEITKQSLIAASLKAGFESEGRHPKAFIQTYGCQQNEADSEKLMGLAEKCGYTKTDTEKDADLIIVNTCAIREHAELRTLSRTGGYKKLKEENPFLLIMFCGCMAQEEHIRAKLKTSYPYVDAVFGTDANHRLPEMIQKAMDSKKRLSFINDLPHADFGVISENVPSHRSSSYKAWVSIMYGCNNYCTYCVVPYVRGRERSRLSSDVLAETNELISRGYRDITLLGQNVNSYKGDVSFPELLRRVASADGDYWVRFMTSHPKDASKELVDVMASSEHIAPHFHLPVQSGSTRILEKMNRRYTREQYLEKVAYIREKLPDAAITTDIICGFPGETEEDFLETLSLVKEVGYDMIYTFVYSPRPGTVAEKMENQIPHEEKVRRFSLISDAENDIALANNKLLVGKTIKVLSDGGRSGRSGQNKPVNFDSEVPEGTFVNVEITDAHPYGLDGKIK